MTPVGTAIEGALKAEVRCASLMKAKLEGKAEAWAVLSNNFIDGH